MPEADNIRGEPHRSTVALLLIDVINDLEFEGGDALLTYALPMAERLSRLKARAKSAGVPAIYVNDNFGRWQSDFRKQLGHCLEDGVRGEPLARLLRPSDDDFFILKPKNSGFYGTALEILLDHLGARTLIITGLSANMCILFTAQDAHMRSYRVVVPPDCVASETTQATEQALALMGNELDVEIVPSEEIDFSRY